MLRTLLFFLAGAISASAQTSVNNEADRLNPPATPATVAPTQQPGNAVMTPGLNGQAGLKQQGLPPQDQQQQLQNIYTLPAAPVANPVIAQVVISPSIVRQGLTDAKAIKTTITLSAPATKNMLCRLVSAQPKMVRFENITIPKGVQQVEGHVYIDWKPVFHNTQVDVKAYDVNNPEVLVHSRIYLRRKME